MKGKNRIKQPYYLEAESSAVSEGLIVFGRPLLILTYCSGLAVVATFLLSSKG